MKYDLVCNVCGYSMTDDDPHCRDCPSCIVNGYLGVLKCDNHYNPPMEKHCVDKAIQRLGEYNGNRDETEGL
jgi:hypothetical protein